MQTNGGKEVREDIAEKVTLKLKHKGQESHTKRKDVYIPSKENNVGKGLEAVYKRKKTIDSIE